MNRPAPKDLSTVPHTHLAAYVIADLVWARSLAERAKKERARREVIANLGGKRAA